LTCKIAARKIQKAFKPLLRKALSFTACLEYSKGMYDQDDNEIISNEFGQIIGRIEDGEEILGYYRFGTFFRIADADAIFIHEDEDSVADEMNTELFKYLGDAEVFMRNGDYSQRLWELCSLIGTIDSDELSDLCERYGLNPCDYANKCGNRRCKNDHPFGTDLLKNWEEYRASKASLLEASSSSTVVSEITDDGNSSVLLSSQPTTNSNFDAKAEEFIFRLSVTEALGESCSKENLLEYLDSDEGDFSALVELFKAPDRIKLKALRKLRLSPQAAIETKSSAPVEPKSTAPPQQVGGGAVKISTCRNWDNDGTCRFGPNCHYKAFHIAKQPPKACHNKAFLSGKVCDWLPNCILCHDRTATPQAQPVAQVQAPAPPPDQPQAHVQVQAPAQPHPQEHAQVQAPAQPPTHPQEHAQVQAPTQAPKKRR